MPHSNQHDVGNPLGVTKPFNWALSSGSDGAATIEKGQGLRFDYSPNGNMQLAVETVLMPGKKRG